MEKKGGGVGTVGGQEGVGEHCSIWTSVGKRTHESSELSPSTVYLKQLHKEKTCILSFIQFQTPECNCKYGLW